MIIARRVYNPCYSNLLFYIHNVHPPLTVTVQLYRRIALTLSLPQGRRGSCIDFVAACRTEYDRLVSSSITIPQSQIKRFKAKFKSIHHSPEVVTGGIGTVTTHGEMSEMQPEDRHGRQQPTTEQRRLRRASTILQDVLINPVGNLPRRPEQAPPPPPSRTRPRLPRDVRRPSAEDVVTGGETFEAESETDSLGRAPTMHLAPEGPEVGDEQYETSGEDVV